MATSWQHSTSFSQTNLHMFEDEILCDIILLAGSTKEKVRCHTFILASRSPVLYTMFCDSLSETFEVIEIPDIEAGTLKELVRFLYSGEATVSADTVMPLLYAAKKYDVVNLRDECSAFLESIICHKNVCVIIDYALQFGEERLVEQCLEFITANATEVLKSEEFCQIPKQVLKLIIEQNDLKSSELSIYEACKRWAKSVCKSNDQKATGRNIREVLGDIIFLIGFPSMHAEEFCDYVTSDDILTKSEVVDIYRDILKKSKSTQFSTFSRRIFNPFIVARATSVARNWILKDKQDGISFQVSKPVTLCAISCYLPLSAGELTGPLELFEESMCLLKQNLSLSFKHGSEFEEVLLNRKIRLVPGKKYSICQRLTGPSTFYAETTNCQVKSSVNDVTVDFMNLINEVSTSDNGTVAERGQFHALSLEC